MSVGGHDWKEIQTYYEAGNSPRDCRTRFRVSLDDWNAGLVAGLVSARRQVNRPPGETRRRVAELLAVGLTQAQVARELGISKPTVCFHARRLGVPIRGTLARRYDWNEISAYYEAGHSAKECQEHFGFSRGAWADAIRRGALVPRPRLEPMPELLALGRRRNRHHVKSRLFQEGLKERQCEKCGISEWLGSHLPLELHHVNGDGLDNRLENLLVLCPNCHSQTANWGARNKGKRAA